MDTLTYKKEDMPLRHILLFQLIISLKHFIYQIGYYVPTFEVHH